MRAVPLAVEGASRTLSVTGRAELEGYAAGAGEHG